MITTPSWLLFTSILAIYSTISVPICAHAQARSAANTSEETAQRYLPASIKVAPDLKCKLHARGSAPASGLTVFTDGDGYARFYAVRARASGQSQMLTCTDEAGRVSSYSVDLTSDATFVNRPLDIANERGIDRPALTGDPLSYTQADLSKRGYGLRPKPDDRMYPIWLEAATKPARMLYAKKPDKFAHPPHTVTSITAGPWVGSVMTGSAPYISVVTSFFVPTLIPGASAAAVIWPGLGGFGTGSGLIQTGVFLQTTPTTANYSTWREYCCGDPDSNGYSGNFTPSPGDKILAAAWYCDANGDEKIAGGYGCSHVHDLTSGLVFSCTLPRGTPGSEICWSVKALPLCSVDPNAANCMTLGQAAEFILENTSPQLTPPTQNFPRFTPFSMVGIALTSAGTITWVDIDPTVSLLTDYTPGPPRVTVALPGNANTYFRTGLLAQKEKKRR